MAFITPILNNLYDNKVTLVIILVLGGLTIAIGWYTSTQMVAIIIANPPAGIP